MVKGGGGAGRGGVERERDGPVLGLGMCVSSTKTKVIDKPKATFKQPVLGGICNALGYGKP